MRQNTMVSAARKVWTIGETAGRGQMEDLLALWRAGGRWFPGNPSFDLIKIHNLADRAAELRLLPLALDRGAAVIINRPFNGGGLFRQVRRKPIPAWAVELGCKAWAGYFLKFIVSHPAVTCAIPATSQAVRMAENMNAIVGEVADAGMRRRMAEYWDRG